MADVAITLKLSASEFQTLREELIQLNDTLAANVRDAVKNPQAYGSREERQAQLRRSSEVALLVEKLG